MISYPIVIPSYYVNYFTLLAQLHKEGIKHQQRPPIIAKVIDIITQKYYLTLLRITRYKTSYLSNYTLSFGGGHMHIAYQQHIHINIPKIHSIPLRGVIY